MRINTNGSLFGGLFIFLFFSFTTFIYLEEEKRSLLFNSNKEYKKVLLWSIGIEILLFLLFLLTFIPFSLIFFISAIAILVIIEFFENKPEIKLDNVKKLLHIPAVILWWLVIPYPYLLMLFLSLGLLLILHVLFIDKYIMNKLWSYYDYCKDNKEKVLNLKTIKEYFYE